MFQHIPTVLILIILQLGGAASVQAQDWPQWRGPHRDGRLEGFRPPETWPEKLTQVWRIEIGGGYSSPVFADGKIFLHTREGDDEVVIGLRLRDGGIVWSERYGAPFEKNSYAVAHGKGPNSTPLVHDGKLYTLGISGILSCFEAASGKLLWRRDYSDRASTKKLFCGSATSPLVDGGLLITHVGDDREGLLVALDAVTGEEKWSWTGAGPGYASPIVAELGGKRQIVTLTDRSAVGVAVADGRLLWELPFPDEWNENIVTPVLHAEHLILAGVRRGTFALRLARQNGSLSPEMVWDRRDLTQYMSSPVVDGGVLYGMTKKQKGQFFALDLASRETLWTSEGRQGQNAAVMSAGDYLFLLTTEAELIVAHKDREAFRPVARYEVAQSPTWPHPLLIGRQIVIKEKDALTLWSLDGPPEGSRPSR